MDSLILPLFRAEKRVGLGQKLIRAFWDAGLHASLPRMATALEVPSRPNRRERELSELTGASTVAVWAWRILLFFGARTNIIRESSGSVLRLIGLSALRHWVPSPRPSRSPRALQRRLVASCRAGVWTIRKRK